MADDILGPMVPAWDLVARSGAIYLALLLGLRLFGKREVGQSTLSDLVTVLLVTNAMQPAMTGPDTSLLGGLIIVATLLLLNRGVSWLRLRSPLFRKALQSRPTVIAQDGRRLVDARRATIADRPAD